MKDGDSKFYWENSEQIVNIHTWTRGLSIQWIPSNSFEKKILSEQRGVSNLLSQELSLLFTGVENDLDFLKDTLLRCPKNLKDCSLENIVSDFAKSGVAE